MENKEDVCDTLHKLLPDFIIKRTCEQLKIDEEYYCSDYDEHAIRSAIIYIEHLTGMGNNG